MKKLFLVAVITLLCMPAIAENLWLNTLEGETYYANKSVIDSLLFLRHPEEMRKIEKRYIVPQDGYAKLDHYVMNRELKYICQDFFLTSSLRTPKIFIKEFGDFLMSCHQHCLGVNLLVQR